MRPANAILALLIFFLILAPPVSPSLAQTDEIEVCQLAGGLYFISGMGGNVAFLVTGEGVLVVDSGSYPSHGRRIMEEIRKVTDKSVKYVVFTHYHGDHTHGISGLDEKAVVVGHRNIDDNLTKFSEPSLMSLVETRYPEHIKSLEEKASAAGKEGGAAAGEALAELEEAKRSFGEARTIRIIHPEATFEEEMTILLGGMTIRIYHPGPTHTSCNSIVHFTDLGAVHMGDMLFYMKHPYIDRDAGCDTSNWIERLREIASWKGLSIVIPGHGEPADPESLLWEAAYLEKLRSEVAAGVEAGKTLEQVVESATMKDYAGLDFTHLLPEAVKAVYREMTGE